MQRRIWKREATFHNGQTFYYQWEPEKRHPVNGLLISFNLSVCVHVSDTVRWMWLCGETHSCWLSASLAVHVWAILAYSHTQHVPEREATEKKKKNTTGAKSNLSSWNAVSIMCIIQCFPWVNGSHCLFWSRCPFGLEMTAAAKTKLK